MNALFLTLTVVVTASAGVINLGDLPMQNPDLFEGDIMGVKNAEERGALVNDNQLWAGGVIPYVIDNIPTGLQGKIRSAIAQYHTFTCLRFKLRTTERNYVRIFQGQGCYSYLGNAHIGAQELSLGTGCEYIGTIVHELGHAVGFWHEQNRSDRDDYLIIMWNNIQAGMDSQFVKLREDQNRLLTDFDYDSIMLYGEKSFSKDKISKTMIAKSGKFLKEVYDKPGFSQNDIKRIKMLYKC
ncbi:astacin-like metalloprotease toxin 5 [Tachypleus tridentatus]|uniref:astacin-like metalloprotease toxin 5 n=1 Tax=Tachypleus tridentatus TaxID=6853 RepID=UPI003FD399A9